MATHERLLLLRQRLIQEFQGVFVDLTGLCVPQGALRLLRCNNSVQWHLADLTSVWQKKPSLKLLAGARLAIAWI